MIEITRRRIPREKRPINSSRLLELGLTTLMPRLGEGRHTVFDGFSGSKAEVEGKSKALSR